VCVRAFVCVCLMSNPVLMSGQVLMSSRCVTAKLMNDNYFVSVCILSLLSLALSLTLISTSFPVFPKGSSI